VSVKVKGWERKRGTKNKSPCAKAAHAQQTGVCAQCLENNQKKENEQTTPFSRKLLNYALLVILLVWLFLYLGCKPHINEYLGYPENPDKVVNAVGLFRAWLNVGMVTIVIFFTYWDRWEVFKEAISNNIEDAAFKKRANALFIPFALAVIPFTTALSDLASLLPIHDYAYHLLMAFLILLIVTDGLVTGNLVRKYSNKSVKETFSNHFWIFLFTIFLWFVMTVILSFPLSI